MSPPRIARSSQIPNATPHLKADELIILKITKFIHHDHVEFLLDGEYVYDGKPTHKQFIRRQYLPRL